MISGKACESVGACVIAYGKFQPSGIAGKVTLLSPKMPDGWNFLSDITHLPATFACLGNVTGNPGVFQGNPHPYPWKPTPAATGVGFRGYGSWV